MEPHGDPEARIRDLERPLADRAGASELGTTPYEAQLPPMPPPYTGGPADQYQQYGQYGAGPQYGSPQYTSPYYAPPQRVVRKRSTTAALWLIPVAVLGVVGAAIAGVVWYANLGSPDSFTANPTPPNADDGLRDGPRSPEAVPGIPTEPTVTVDPGGFTSIGGIDMTQTVICNDGTVNISGVNNDIDIVGNCTSVTVSGIDNDITIESASTISASGFDNQVTYRAGTPEISTSGTGNVVEQG